MLLNRPLLLSKISNKKLLNFVDNTVTGLKPKKLKNQGNAREKADFRWGE